MKNLIFIAFFFSFVLGISQEERTPLEIIVQRGHDKPVTCVDFSNSGDYLASGSQDFSIKLWDVKSGFQIRSFGHHSQSVIDLNFSPDAKRIISVAWDSKVVLQEVNSGKLLWVKDFGEISPRSVAFSKDGGYVLVSTNRDYFFVLDASTGKDLLREKKYFSSAVNSGYMNSLKGLVAVEKDYEHFSIKDIKTKKDLFTLSSDKPRTFSFSKDGRFLVVGSDKLLTEVFDLELGKKTHSLTTGDRKCDGCGTIVKFFNTKNLFISGADESGFTIWNPKSGRKKETILVNKESTGIEISNVEHVEISDDDQRILFQGSKSLVVYDIQSKNFVFKHSAYNLRTFEASFSPAFSSKIILTDDAFGLYLMNVITKKKETAFHGYLNRERGNGIDLSYNDWLGAGMLSYMNRKTSVALSPDNKWLIKGGVDSTIFLIDFKTGQLKKQLSGHSKLVYLFKFDRSGSLLATAGGGREILLWNTETWQVKGVLKGHVGSIYDLKFNRDGTELISSSWDGVVRVWDLATLEPKEYYGNKKNIASYSVDYLPSELYFIHGDFEQKIRIVERNTKRTFRELIGHTGTLSGIAFDEDKDMIFTSSWDGMLKGWSLSSQMMKFSLKPHNESVYSLTYDRNKKWLVSGGADNQIHVWDIVKESVVARLVGHNAPVTSVNVSSDDKYLVSSGADGEIKVWDYETFQELYSYNQINRNDWLVTNPGGYFDGSKNALQLVNYVKGLKVIPISTLFNKYYTPSLSKRIMAGERFSSIDADFNQRINTIPEVHVSWSAKDNFILKSDSLSSSKSNKVYVDLAVHSNSKEQHVIRIYRNGKLINNVFVSKNSGFKESHVPIRLVDGKNELSFIAINNEKTSSVKNKLTIFYDGIRGKTDLYVLAVGINRYQNPEYDLNFAIDDAEAFSKKLVKGSDTLFNKTHSFLVKNPVKSEIKEAVKKINSEIGPEDVFVFFYAGHGVMRYERDSSEFFLVLKDVTSMHGDYESLVTKGLSAHDLMNVSKEISAEKQLYVLDACNSGGVLQTMAYRGVEREKALAQLAHSTGTFYLTASQQAQYANEAWELKHGVFTYCLLEVLSGKDAGSSQDSKITVSEMKSYVEDRVPVVSKENQGLAQYPTSFGFGQDFPLIILK